jgi:uncharacterized membrane protein
MTWTPSTRVIRASLAVVGLVGLAVSTYLTVERALGRAPSCVIGGGCSVVQASRYSELVGVPVAWLGIAGYLGIILAAVLPGPRGALLGLFVTTISVGFSGWLTYVELAKIKEVCAWCVVSAILAVIAFGLSLLRMWALAPDDVGAP